MTSSQDLKEDALSVLRSALSAADAGNAVRAHFKMPQSTFERIVVLAVGKAAYAMADAVTSMLPRASDSVIVVTKHNHAGPARAGWMVHETGHPIPDEPGLRASEAVRDAVAPLSKKDLLIVAISGGASALLPAPADPVTLADKQHTTDLLLRCGADIRELNKVRTQLSYLKGGRLAALANPAQVVGLLLSDVVGDLMEVIGSGPTVPNPSTAADAERVLRKYGLWERVPDSVREKLAWPDALRVGGMVQNIVVGSNRLALEAAASRARKLGYQARVISDCVQGEAVEVARQHAEWLKQAQPGTCLLSGGETTVTVQGNGKGGRNQEFALALALAIEGLPDRAALCAGTDGTDGPTDAAGAYVDGFTVQRARMAGMHAADYLRRNDSYPFFESLGDLVKTGPTGTNVMDVNLLLVRKS